MLEEIVVSNLGLIPEASISPAEGLTVITGETGAGKTVMLGALRLLVGEPATRTVIGPHGDTADVSARFVDPGETVVRRVVSQRRSKAYLDGAISTASALKETIGPLVSIVGQHDQHTITSPRGVGRIVDQLLTDKGRASLDAYRSAWDGYQLVRAEADMLGTDHRHIEREIETVRFQIKEIDEAGFSEGDEEELRGRVTRLRNASGLAVSVDAALVGLGDDGAGGHVSAAARALERATDLDGSLRELSDQVENAAGMLSDLAAEVARYAADLDIDPMRLEETEQRVALLGALKRKYGDSLEDINAFRKEAVVRESELTALIESAGNIADRLDEATQELAVRGHELTDARRKASRRIAQSAVEHLKALGFTTPLVSIPIEHSNPGPMGADTATVMFASDEGLELAPVSAIASGGELSRLVLALTIASGSADAQVVAFDEIDTGIGGATALAMGRKLASLAEDRQVICVTHLPQVAAFADRHFVVAREGSTTTISEAEGDARTEELARMLAGLSASKKGREHASELMEIASKSRTGQ